MPSLSFEVWHELHGNVLEQPVKRFRDSKPQPIKDKPTLENRFQEYLALAKKIGTGITEVLEGRIMQQQIADFLWEQDIEMYDYREVCDYMRTMAAKEGKLFFWSNLREQDRKYADQNPDNRYDMGIPYKKLVPFEILQNVEKLQNKFGNEVAFLVSDYAVSYPDPFICVTGLEVDRIVFGVWDEPAFFTKGAK